MVLHTLQSDVKAGVDLVGPLGALSNIVLESKSPLNAMVKRPKPVWSISRDPAHIFLRSLGFRLIWSLRFCQVPAIVT